MKTQNILILNLMPTKEDTERQLLNRLSHASYPINVTFLTTATYQCRHASREHMQKYYKVFHQIENRFFDGMIITGAPVECLEYDDVIYWNELCGIMEWSKRHVTSTLHICWGAQAGIYYHFGIEKQLLSQKRSGIYTTHINHPEHPLLKGIGNTICSPISCYTTITRDDVEQADGLTILAESKQTDVFLAASNDCRQIFLFGHPEYDLNTLDKEYHRDLKNAACNPQIPVNYYPCNDPLQAPEYSWYKPSCDFFSNWIQNYVAKGIPNLV